MPDVIDWSAVKSRQQATWAAGDYAVIGTTQQIVGEMLCEAVDLRGGERVLDVAAGNGNCTLAAARRFGEVTSTDYVPALLERGRVRAEAEHLDVVFETADAEALPYADAAFDVVLSSFGVMFAPDQARAAAEMVRVCRPGGRIGLANWTPASYVGRLFRLLGDFVPPPAGVPPPTLWGTAERLGALFPGIKIEATPRSFAFRYRSPAHYVDVFRSYFGPVQKAFLALDAERKAELERGMLDLIARFDRGGGRGMVVGSDYLEVVIRR